MGTEVERRQGMDEFARRLQRVEHIVLEQLGDPVEGKEGSFGRRMAGMEGTLGDIDRAIRGDGNGEPGFAARLRSVEKFKDAGKKGDRSLIDRVQDLEFKVWLLITGLGIVSSVVGKIAWEWVKVAWLGSGG